MEEEWRKVPDLPWYYEVSNFGRVKSLARINRRGCRIKTRILVNTQNAEFFANLEDGTQKWCALAAMVLKAFVGPAPSKVLNNARHLDDDRNNNHVSNLAWGTHQDNTNDAIRNGRKFDSYGHLGKLHSQSTKDLISRIQKGKPTGMKMSPTHKAAIMTGYRKKFPEKNLVAELCQCGCGILARAGSKFIHGHAGRVRFQQIAKARIGKLRAW